MSERRSSSRPRAPAAASALPLGAAAAAAGVVPFEHLSSGAIVTLLILHMRGEKLGVGCTAAAYPILITRRAVFPLRVS